MTLYLALFLMSKMAEGAKKGATLLRTLRLDNYLVRMIWITPPR